VYVTVKLVLDYVVLDYIPAGLGGLGGVDGEAGGVVTGESAALHNHLH
jgi:hypothetical protein